MLLSLQQHLPAVEVRAVCCMNYHELVKAAQSCMMGASCVVQSAMGHAVTLIVQHDWMAIKQIDASAAVCFLHLQPHAYLTQCPPDSFFSVGQLVVLQLQWNVCCYSCC